MASVVGPVERPRVQGQAIVGDRPKPAAAAEFHAVTQTLGPESS
jgi:hypothetical protein